jgi:SAM-dependent methyltransferase
VDKPREQKIKDAVRAYYGARATEPQASCCGPAPCCVDTDSEAQTDSASEGESRCCAEVGAIDSLGCGDPLAFVDFQEGQVVLDLGSGFGLEVILAAQMVGETGKVIGLDMTPAMIDKAKKNAERAGVGHTTDFRLGEMENMPVEDESVDWIISNCVLNLSPHKERVFQEAYRVLKPGGRMMISDLVSSGLPEVLKRDLTSWAQCLGGTVEEAEYLGLMTDAGFEEVVVVDRFDATVALVGSGCCGPSTDATSGPRIESIRVSATKRSSG